MRREALIPLFLLGCMARAMAAVPADCRTLAKHGRASEAQACFKRLAQSEDAYTRAEGFWGLEEWDQANEQFRVATQAADGKPAYKVRWGLLLHERFNDTEAADLFHEALAKDPKNAEAYVGLARVSAAGFDGRAVEYLGKAMELDGKLAEPHELMAELALENDDRTMAAAEADRAIALEPEALNAMATHASLEILADRSPDAWFARIRAVNPAYGEGYAQVAHQLELHYRYEDAATYYRKAVELSPRLWAAHSALGIEQMRMGKEDEPRQQLEMSYNNDYRNAATVNSLRLLDSYKNFQTLRDDVSIVKLHKSEAALLAPYMQAELHTIVATYSRKYQMKLAEPVQVEAYPDHEDFAVRTMGMPGLGALGVTFGDVIAMDSPSAHKPGDFNWGATLWHEMSHVFILTATNHRVPRWFTEGLAVHEEGQRSAEWGNRVTPEVLMAIREKKLLPVARLDRGFVYQDYPSQVMVSYFQAGAICDFIQQKWGEAKLLDMVHSYAKLETTQDAIKEDLGITADEFDARFLTWIEGKYGAEATHFDEWQTRLKVLVAAARQKQWEMVAAEGPRVVALFPEYVDVASAYEWIALADQSRGDAKSEAAILTAYEHAGGENPAMLKRLATLEETAGDKTEAAATLERIVYIYPVKDEELHRHLGDLLYAQKQYDGAIREYNALVASNPVDKAGAEFSLAQAYFAANRKDKAEESVLAALETAPGYRPAQKLLLELQQPQAPAR